MLKNKAAQGPMSLQMSKCHIVGNHMSRLICDEDVLCSVDICGDVARYDRRV